VSSLGWDWLILDLKKAFTIYQYCERIKSELLILSGLVDEAFKVKTEEAGGAEKVIVSFFEALIGEIRIAQHSTKMNEFFDAELRLKEALGNFRLKSSKETQKSLSETVSKITTACSKAVEVLAENNLI